MWPTFRRSNPPPVPSVPLRGQRQRLAVARVMVVRPLDHITKPEHHTIMKLSNGKKFRLGAPKYSKTSQHLISIYLGCFLISWLVSEPAKAWFDRFGGLTIIALLVVYLAGMIAERKEWEAAHKIDDSK